MTPEDIWDRDVLLLEDQSDIFEYMAERVNEYLSVLRPADIDWSKFQPKSVKDLSQWKHGTVVFLLICIMFMYS